MKYKLLIPLVLFLFAACIKTKKNGPATPRESFCFKGYIRDCVTGKPYVNEKVSVCAVYVVGMAHDYHRAAGSTYTDENGYYEIYPYKTEYFANGQGYFEIEGNAIHVSMGFDEIMKSDSSSFQFNGDPYGKGFLKINLYSQTFMDSADFLELKGNCLFQKCPHGGMFGFNGSNASYELGGISLGEQVFNNTNGEYIRYVTISEDSIQLRYYVHKQGVITDSGKNRFLIPTDKTVEFDLKY